MRRRFLEHNNGPVLLAGASAGAWRCLAIAARQPLEAYEMLRLGYSRNVFTRKDTPATISEAFRKNVYAYLTDEEIKHLLTNKQFRLAIHTTRSSGLGASSNKWLEASAIILSGVVNTISPTGMRIFYEKVIFFSGSEPPDFIKNSFEGHGAPLTEENIRDAGVATGSLPYIMAGVKNVAGAPPGVYRDGGWHNYQLNEDYCPGPDGMTLFFHYQERIVPSWMDKPLPWRKPSQKMLERVLQIYPGEDFIRMLPDQRLPDRNDFVEFVDNPEERFRRWDDVAEKSEILGTQFMEDVESGRIRDLVKPL
jgi:hypothetical protein